MEAAIAGLGVTISKLQARLDDAKKVPAMSRTQANQEAQGGDRRGEEANGAKKGRKGAGPRAGR